MKKLFLTLAIMLGVVSMANAQEAGKIWVGGSIGFSSSKAGDGDRVTAYKILPEVGYVLSDNLAIAIGLGYAHNNSVELLGERGVIKDAFLVNPYLRYSFLKGNIGNLFMEAGGTYMNLKGDESSDKTNYFEVGIKPGVAVKVSDKIALTGKLGFLGYQHGKNGDYKADSFGLDFDLRKAEIGVNIFF